MRKHLALLLIVSLLLCPLCNGFATTSDSTQRLALAFGLFSVEVPADAVIGPNTGGFFYALHYELSTFPGSVAANFAPIAEYKGTAQRKLDSYISLLFTICGEGYSETEVAEETLANGIRLRWQLMRGDQAHVLWFEAFSEDFGYNIAISGSADEPALDERMLALMRSFQADPERERDILEIRQQKRADGSFVSVEHGLQIQLDTEWKEVTIPNLLRSDTAFMLEKWNAQWLIQLLYHAPADPDQAKDLLNWYIENMRKVNEYDGHAAFGEPYSLSLDGLNGLEAWAIEEERTNINIINIAFVHESYGYLGSFMWIKALGDAARPWMEQAIQSICAAE